MSDSSEIEIVSERLIPKLPSPELEMAMMYEHERFGHYHRVCHRQEQNDRVLKRIREEMAAESTEARRARRKSFRRAVFGTDE